MRIPADQKQWNGASPQASTTHIAITERLDSTGVQWMEKVSDEQYNSRPDSRCSPTRLLGDVWRRPEWSPRDRSLVTVSVLIATGKPSTALLPNLLRSWSYLETEQSQPLNG